MHMYSSCYNYPNHKIKLSETSSKEAQFINDAIISELMVTIEE
jgi:hypothetical protein